MVVEGFVYFFLLLGFSGIFGGYRMGFLSFLVGKIVRLFRFE